MKGLDPTAEEILVVEIVDVRVAEGGVAVAGVPIDTEEYVLEWTLELVKNGGVDPLARCLAIMLDRQAVALLAIGYLGWSTSHLHRALGTRLSLKACRRADDGAQWTYEKMLELTGAVEAQSFL